MTKKLSIHFSVGLVTHFGCSEDGFVGCIESFGLTSCNCNTDFCNKLNKGKASAINSLSFSTILTIAGLTSNMFKHLIII